MDSAGDPVVAFGPDNTVYYGNIVFSRSLPFGPAFQMASGIAVNVSRDGGLRWREPRIIQLDGVDLAGNPTPTEFFDDKIWLAADRSSGRVYVTWSRFAFPGGSYLESPIVVSASRDYGRTFTSFTRVAPPLQGFAGGVTPYEASLCATLACDQPTDRDATVVATSRNRVADLRIHPCWTDFRGRPGVTKPNQDAYTQSISLR